MQAADQGGRASYVRKQLLAMKVRTKRKHSRTSGIIFVGFFLLFPGVSFPLLGLWGQVGSKAFLFPPIYSRR